MKVVKWACFLDLGSGFPKDEMREREKAMKWVDQ
jgi:hypothetical protein